MARLRSKFISSDDWNQFQNALVEMQLFLKNNVEGYIDGMVVQVDVARDNALIAIDQKKNAIIVYLDSLEAGKLRNDIGVMAELNTNAKNSLVAAVNEVNSKAPTDASTTQKGIVQLASTSSTSEVLAATPKLVKDVSDALTTHSNITTTSVHGSTSAATANRIIQRDASGRAKVAAPSAVDDIARLDTVTGQVGTLSSLQTTAKTNVVSAINEVFQSGVNAKQGMVDAINAKGGSASINDTWDSLFAKVRAISTTMKYTKIMNINQDAAASNANVYTTPALGFTPKLIEVNMSFNTYFGSTFTAVNCILTADKLSGVVEYRRGSSGAAYGYFSNVTFNANTVTFGVLAVNTDLSGTHATTIRSVCVYGD
nr:phage tail protein [Paenibacillus sp. Marseille-Q4541]